MWNAVAFTYAQKKSNMVGIWPIRTPTHAKATCLGRAWYRRRNEISIYFQEPKFTAREDAATKKHRHASASTTEVHGTWRVVPRVGCGYWRLQFKPDVSGEFGSAAIATVMPHIFATKPASQVQAATRPTGICIGVVTLTEFNMKQPF